jgi:hypothetical protein
LLIHERLQLVLSVQLNFPRLCPKTDRIGNTIYSVGAHYESFHLWLDSFVRKQIDNRAIVLYCTLAVVGNKAVQ